MAEMNLIERAGAVASQLVTPDESSEPEAVLAAGPVTDERLLALAFWELAYRLDVMRQAYESAVKPTKTHRCGWCHRGTGGDDAAWLALETMDLEAVQRHTLTCRHNPLVNRVEELEAAAERLATVALGSPGESRRDESDREAARSAVFDALKKGVTL